MSATPWSFCNSPALVRAWQMRHEKRQAASLRSVTQTSDLLLAAFVCSLIVTTFLGLSESFQHWFILPLIVCGTLIGSDLIAWIRRREMLFDPAGLLSVMGFHFFFLAPLLIVLWEYRIPYLQGQPDDWRQWLGLMGILNAAGLYIYRWVRGFIRGRVKTATTYRRLDHHQFPMIAGAAILVCSVLQVYIYISFGGITGFVDRYLNDSDVWQNTGWMFAIAESAPILAMLALAVRLRKSSQKPSWPLLTLVLVSFFGIQLFFGALRGSRMNTLICLFWAAGVVHYWIRPVDRKLVFSGVACVLVFMYFAAFYKDAGLRVFDAFQGSEERDMLTAKTHRTFQQVVVADLSRSDIQAFVAYRLLQPTLYELGWGRTYVGAMTLLVPRTLWPGRPPGKVKWTTEAEYGIGSYSPNGYHSSRVYGISGEMMLNFGILAAPLGLLIIGMIVGRIQRFLDSTYAQDCRLLLIPIFICFCISALILDSDNLVYFVVKYVAIPVAVVFCASRTVSIPGASRG